MNKEEKENIISKVKFILQGIDQAETDSKEGWWETSAGASFGEEKLAKIIQAIEEPKEVKSLPSSEEIAQFVIDNRYKTVLMNLSDFELFHAINDKIKDFASLYVEQERNNIEIKILKILEGIDSDYKDIPEGWWSNSSEVEFGSGILKKIKSVFKPLNNGN